MNHCSVWLNPTTRVREKGPSRADRATAPGSSPSDHAAPLDPDEAGTRLITHGGDGGGGDGVDRLLVDARFVVDKVGTGGEGEAAHQQAGHLRPGERSGPAKRASPMSRSPG